MTSVFLDLDGTLVDPKLGITQSIIYALTKLGISAPSPDELEWCIGPSLFDSFQKLGVPDAALALQLYRERYKGPGLTENSVYFGIPTALGQLQSDGHILYLATAKPIVFARKITADFGLSAYFNDEFGSELDGTRGNKAELLAFALDRLGLDARSCVMVGDRNIDIQAARAVEMPVIAVTWGYGGPEETRLADLEIDHPRELAIAVKNISTS